VLRQACTTLAFDTRGRGLLEITRPVVAFVRGQTLADYVASRDPLSGSAYAIALLLFAAMPAVISHRRSPR